MNVINLLSDVPITRNMLCNLTGMTDREVRKEIEKAKQTLPIVNTGRGYYIASDPDDPDLQSYIRAERAKALNILKNLKAHKMLAGIDVNQEVLDERLDQAV